MIAILRRNYILITLSNIKVIIVMADGERISGFSGLTKNILERDHFDTQCTVDFHGDRKSDPVGSTRMHSDTMTTGSPRIRNSISALKITTTNFFSWLLNFTV